MHVPILFTPIKYFYLTIQFTKTNNRIITVRQNVCIVHTRPNYDTSAYNKFHRHLDKFSGETLYTSLATLSINWHAYSYTLLPCSLEVGRERSRKPSYNTEH